MHIDIIQEKKSGDWAVPKQEIPRILRTKDEETGKRKGKMAIRGGRKPGCAA